PGNDSGLFGYVEGDGDIDGESDGHVTGVILVDPSVVSTTATANVGALVGRAVNARIEKIEIMGGTVSSTGANTGGIVGLLEGQHGLLIASKAETTVNGVTQVGGAVG